MRRAPSGGLLRTRGAEEGRIAHYGILGQLLELSTNARLLCLCVDVIAAARRAARVSTERQLEPGCSSIITNPSSVPRHRVRRGAAGRAVGTDFWRSAYWDERPRDTAERCTAAGTTHAGSGDEVQSAGTGSGGWQSAARQKSCFIVFTDHTGSYYCTAPGSRTPQARRARCRLVSNWCGRHQL